MRSSTFISRLSLLAEMNSIFLPENNLCCFEKIYNLLTLWSKKINITSNLSPDAFIVENVLDPVLAYNAFPALANSSNFPCPHLQRGGSFALADVGCGGGFVGFAWHLLNNENGQLFLIDSDRKKINFCKEVIRKLSLKNCNAICSRVEDVREPLANIVVTRATWDPSETRKRCAGLALSNAVLVRFCGPKTVNKNNDARLISYTMKNPAASSGASSRIKNLYGASSGELTQAFGLNPIGVVRYLSID